MWGVTRRVPVDFSSPLSLIYFLLSVVEISLHHFGITGSQTTVIYGPGMSVGSAAARRL